MKPSLLLFAVSCVYAQTLEFEVASVKHVESTAPVAAGAIRGAGGGGRGGVPQIGQVNYPPLTFKDLVQRAYSVKDYQVAGPDWISTERYSIVAKLPEGGTTDQIPQMLQSLLASRFLMKLHREQRSIPIYALQVGKDGTKLKEGDDSALKSLAQTNERLARAMNQPGVEAFMMTTAAGRIAAKNATMARLTDLLSRQLDRPVIDETQLTGSYSFILDWLPDGAPNPTETADDRIGLPLPAALQSQLGLRLEKRNAPADILVIDHAEKTPTGN